MSTYEEVANLFVKELERRHSKITASTYGQRVLIHQQEPTVCSELVAAVLPAFDAAEIEIFRTSVNRRRVVRVGKDINAAIKKAADTYVEIWYKLSDRHKLVQLRNQEVDIAKLPRGVGLVRQPDGNYKVLVEMNMPLASMKKLIEFLESLPVE